MPSPRSTLSARRKAPVGVGVLLVVALRRDDQEARRALRRPLADPVEQLVRDDRLVRDHEHVRLALLTLARDDDVPDRQPWRGALDLLDDVPAHPAGALGCRGSRR